MPDDIDAMRAFVQSASSRGDYARARELGGKIEKAGKAEGTDLNQTAWYALFIPAVGKDEIETALKAARMSQNNPSELHTLGCVYAEAGKTKEAREVLIQSMDLLALDEPRSEYWYAFGRIAEQYGLRDVALADYGRVTRPKTKIELPGSSYQLAQNRLKVMGSTTDQVPPAKK
jgi:tetratricopeptide (TPR) repeat protein